MASEVARSHTTLSRDLAEFEHQQDDGEGCN